MIDRRKFITASTALSTSLLAGCSGNGNGDNEPSPEDREFSVNEDAPARPIALSGAIQASDLQFRDEFMAEVRIGNAGGKPIEEPTEFRFSLSHRDSDVEGTSVTGVVVEKLESGATTTVTVGPLTPPQAGEWELTPDPKMDVHDDYDVVTTVSPLEYGLGDMMELEPNLQITLTERTLEQSLLYTEGTKAFEDTPIPGLVTSLDSQVIALLKFTVKNGGTERISVDDNGQFQTAPTEAYTDFKKGDISSDFIEGTALQELIIDPGASETAWLATPIDIADLPQLQFKYSTDSSSESTEFIYNLGVTDPKLPEFELVELDLPAERRPGEENELAIIVKNTGDATGTFRGILQYDQRWSDIWANMADPYEAEIAPGESERAVVISESEDAYNYRVMPFEKEFTI